MPSLGPVKLESGASNAGDEGRGSGVPWDTLASGGPWLWNAYISDFQVPVLSLYFTPCLLFGPLPCDVSLLVDCFLRLLYDVWECSQILRVQLLG